MDKIIEEEKKIQHEMLNVVNQDRVLNFPDCLFAFAATLLVLKIDLPELTEPHVTTQLQAYQSYSGEAYNGNRILPAWLAQ